jgi:hypothetical protein
MRPVLVGPRRFFTVDVDVTNLLDLRVSEHRDAVALDLDALRGPWEPCQRVGLAAHQFVLHGIIAPAATRLGLYASAIRTTCPSSSGRLLLRKVSGPISHPTRAACARSTSSPPESRRVGFGHTTLPTSVGSSESVVRAAGAMVFVPVPATDAACRAQVSWHGPRRSSSTGRDPSGARSPCRKRIRLRDTAKEPSRTTTSSTVAASVLQAFSNVSDHARVAALTATHH